MFISHNTIKTKCHFDLVTLLESCGGKVWWETCLIQEFFSLLRRPPPFRSKRVELIFEDESNYTSSVPESWYFESWRNKPNWSLGSCSKNQSNSECSPNTTIVILYSLINRYTKRLAFYENLLRQKLDNIYFLRMLLL